MITTINNKHNKLNFSNEREQSQTCLNSAEHEKNQGRKVLNVPNLRFKEFQGEWTTSLLSDYLTENKERNKKGEFDKTDVLSVSGDYGIVNQIELLGRSFAGASVLPYHVVRHGNIVYTKSPLKEYPYGIVKANTGVDGIVSTLYAVYNIKNNVDAQFIEYYFSSANRTNRYFKPIVRIGAKHDMKISNQEVLANKVTFPNLEEQTKIASLFRFLDERIATQNKIIDKLQSLIKGMEDNLLNNPLWEKTYLRSFMQFFSTNSLSWEQLSYDEGEIRNLHYGLIHGFQTRGINSASLPMIKNEAVPKQYTLCQVGDVAFADASEDTGEIAKSVEFVDTIEGDTICGLHTIHGRDIKNRTVVGFKGFAFNSRYFHNQIKRLAQGTKVFSITANNLSSCYVYLPDLETQKAIVELLKAYEAQLIVSRKTLKQYEKQKQYLLRQMFI